MTDPTQYLTDRIAFLEGKYNSAKDDWTKNDLWPRIIELKEVLRFTQEGKCLFTGDIQKGEFKDLEKMEELKQQIAHLIVKFGYEAVIEELQKQSPIHPDSGGGDGDSDADDGIGGIQDAPGDV